MCDFKPEDEVVCVDNSRADGTSSNLIVGAVYVIEAVLPSLGGWSGYTGSPAIAGLRLVGIVSQTSWRNTFDCRRFRKVVRKSDKLSLTEWLSQPSGDTERLDKSKKRNRVNG